jgi:hypothetical protein
VISILEYTRHPRNIGGDKSHKKKKGKKERRIE